MSPPAALRLPDHQALDDLETFLGRAKRADPDGATRLAGHGDLLAVYVSPVHGGGGPTVLGLRTVQLAAPCDVDVTVTLASLADRFARLRSTQPPEPAEPVTLPLPPVEAVGVAWAGMAPPRRGWQSAGLLDPELLRAAAAAGIEDVAAGAPTGSGALAVAQLRGRVWGRPLADVRLEGGAEAPVPAGVAFAAQALGFLVDGEPVALYVAGPWTRLTSSRGHVLARTPPQL